MRSHPIYHRCRDVRYTAHYTWGIEGNIRSMQPTSSNSIHQIEIFCEAVPKTAENFLALCASNYYDGCIFHRNIKGFMIQTGDPAGTGKGGQSIWGKPFSDEIRSTLKFNARGMVAMANSGPDTNKSQFFITYSKQAHLDGKYTIFGKVIDGSDTALDAMERAPVNNKNRPLDEIKLTSITIHANPIADAQLQR
ncbi:probable Peptidyl-prolyl cis-trans isomerase-like 3 [Armillaria ostoyae]|uniref:Peptidyl-prolyl cis-trans isomerase n=1 Tax=Armillaria ostoyae TaxID=47428 RepID=A0A284RMB6_ARMOS|nr:probable Peptidyl-prolyl cis-trans isomerase-like 3 [Armillaria ostoyae]